MVNLADENISLLVLVGKNGEGKSYHLENILNQLPHSAIYISEEGIVRILLDKNRITIDKERNLYLYTDERTRGGATYTEQQAINESALNVINYCTKIAESLSNIINKSQGQKKLQNIMGIFTSYNLNNISFVLFDEPENFLDEEYLRVITGLIQLLLINNYKVRIATHNSRLLSLLNVDIDNIILLSNRNEIQVTMDDVKQAFRQMSELIERERLNQRFVEDASIKYKLSILNNDTVFTNFIESNLKNIEFYRALFYTSILIVEGYSDVEALNSIKYLFDNSTIIYSSNGKCWIPFYAKLFLKYNKEVTTIIDVDTALQNHATAITTVLENMTNVRVVKHEPDMETFYEIDTEAIGISLGMSKRVRGSNRGWLKQISAFSHFKNATNSQILTNHIFGTRENVFEFE